jgi:hypothetical protein
VRTGGVVPDTSTGGGVQFMNSVSFVQSFQRPFEVVELDQDHTMVRASEIERVVLPRLQIAGWRKATFCS